MKQSLFIPMLLAGLVAPVMAQASSVLLPGSDTANPYVAAPLPASPSQQPADTEKTAAPVAPKAAASVPLPPATPEPSYGGQSHAPPQAPILYISPAQQKQMIEAEQQAVTATQQSLIQMQRMPTANMTPEEQAQNRQVQAEMASEIRESQERLKLLQSGPLSATDLAKLYRGP